MSASENQVIYKGRQYKLLWKGRTQAGALRARLAFNTGQSFWVDADRVTVNGQSLALLIEQEEEVRQINEQESRADTADPALIPTLLPVYPFQAAGVLYAGRVRNCLIADEQGLGKTIQALGLLQLQQAYPALVICPATVKLNWVRETERFTGRSAIAVNGKIDVEAIKGTDVTVINYDILQRHLEVLKALPFAALILDEAHAIKSGSSQRSKAAQQLSQIKTLEHRLCLTGTPVLNRPEELVELLIFLKALGRRKTDAALLGTRWRFLERYCGARRDHFGHWDFSGATNLVELSRRLRSTVMVRREKSQVLKDLPPKTRSVIPVKLSNLVEYDQIEHRFYEWLEIQLRKRPELGSMTERELIEKLLSIADAGSETIMQMTALRGAVGRGKIEAAKGFVADFLETGSKLVVFAYHQDIQKALHDHFGGLRLFAEDTVARRQEAIDSFQTDPSQKLIIVSLKAGQLGITLTSASHALMVEYDWTPANLEQAEDRLHRIGQQTEYPVTIYYLHAPDTFDDVLKDRLVHKSQVISMVTA